MSARLRHLGWALPLLCVACGDRPDTPPAPAAPTTGASGNVAAPANPANVFVARVRGELPGLEARMTGAFTFRGGCLMFDMGGRPALPVFPRDGDPVIEDAGLRFGNRLVRYGEEVTVGGGSVHREHPIMQSLVAPPPAGCPDEGVVIGELVE